MAGRLEITVLTGVSAGDIFRFSFDQKKSVIIGRDPGSDLVLQDPQVSRRHAMIECNGDSLAISDLGSSHGTIHMGFHLEKGPQGARVLNKGDEFKIGESIFRVHLDGFGAALNQAVKPEEKPKAESVGKKSPGKDSSSTGGRLGAVTQSYRVLPQRKKILYGLVGVVSVLGLVWLVLPAAKAGMPKQKSNEVMLISGQREEIIGFITVGTAAKDKDLTHRDKAQFYLPPGDVVIEYDFRGDAPVDVFVDQSFVSHLDPSPDGWQQRELIVRDILIGKERKLIFDNTEFPLPPNLKGTGSKHWGIRNIRVTPIVRSIELTFNQQLDASITLAEKMDNSADGPYVLLRGLQETILGALFELNQEAVEFAVPREGAKPDTSDVCTKLEKVKEERGSNQSPETLARHQQVLVQLTMDLEGELWRGIFSRLHAAERSAKLKNYIQAHDTLLAAKAMFSDGLDYRWVLANKMFMNKKIVPKMVREQPEQYRKEG